MREMESVENILDFAIENEREAVQFYTGLAERGNRRGAGVRGARGGVFVSQAGALVRAYGGRAQDQAQDTGRAGQVPATGCAVYPPGRGI